MNVLVTGSNGFIGKNLTLRLKELGIVVLSYTRNNSNQYLKGLIKDADFIVHLAGENRPKKEEDFITVNVKLTDYICSVVRSSEKKIPVILASSSQSGNNTAYGKSKLHAEDILYKLEKETKNPIYVYRLPGVFGKWSKPNYNSVVATFCYNINQGLPIVISDAAFELSLVYIDDVVEEFSNVILGNRVSQKLLSVKPEYKITLGDLSSQIHSFKESRNSLITEKVGFGIIHKLYSTYLSYTSPNQFSYSIPSHKDKRGIFAEILKTKDSGQFSFFTAKPGVTRGGHYHHSKTEKFLVVKGTAKFCFRHLSTLETYETITTSKELKIVETVPGWSHDITNISSTEMIVLLWANEIFDHDNPDTIYCKV